MTGIQKLYACGFGMDSHDVRRVAFTFQESNAVEENFSVYKNGKIRPDHSVTQ
jgi:hypothetical protein